MKLNNIEYAMQALDKLEKLMNVEGCAEALAKVDGPKQQAKRPNKYIFTVKIIEAEDVKACDPNGTSDPYVILCDEYQKRLARTRVVMRNLNPRWDESVDVTVAGPLNLIATVWDYDTFGDDDFVGRTSLKLDPVHFSDYLPREFWLDLDTQGRILLRVSMEGERDDILFHFGKAFRHLKRTERDMVRKITDKVRNSSPKYCFVFTRSRACSHSICLPPSHGANSSCSCLPTSTRRYLRKLCAVCSAGASPHPWRACGRSANRRRLLSRRPTSRMPSNRYSPISTTISP